MLQVLEVNYGLFIFYYYFALCIFHFFSFVATQVIVHITDENDCSPEFLQSIYSRENILESVPVGTSLLQGRYSISCLVLYIGKGQRQTCRETKQNTKLLEVVTIKIGVL